MTPYIEAKKAEFREKFNSIKVHGVSVALDTSEAEAFIDTLLDEIQEAVRLPEKGERTRSDYDAGYEQGWNQREYKLEAAFQHLRTGVGTEV